MHDLKIQQLSNSTEFETIKDINEIVETFKWEILSRFKDYVDNQTVGEILSPLKLDNLNDQLYHMAKNCPYLTFVRPKKSDPSTLEIACFKNDEWEPLPVTE